MSEGTPAAEFAALLRELKDRSGLSYGVLAKRLHMSTSTLHRYCNGDAVPTDYAPVERLARLCKAGPGELVELHRRWVLADAARGRRSEPAVTPTAPAPEERADPGAEGAGGPVTAVPAESPATEVPEADVPVIGVPQAEGAGAPRPGPRPRRRTRTAVLAGTAVAVVLAGVTLAVSLPEGGTGGDGRRGPAGAATVGGGDVTSSPSPSATPSASASASRSASASASGSPDAKGGNASSPPAAGAAAPPGTPPGDGAVPLTVRTDPYVWESPCSQRYLIDKAPGEVHPPPIEDDATAWVAAERAVSSGEQYVRLTVQGTGAETVVVEGLTVRVAGKRAPLAWNDYAMGYPGVGCGGGVPTRAFTVALDAARPGLTPQSGHRDFPFKVSESDPEVYYITADASAYDVSWYLELKWSSGSRSGTLTVDDEGRPFRTSGNNGRPSYEFPLGGETWVPEGTTKVD
ncbi:helix-turn-helix domain-containing protein [Streptomyces marokkonensis]|uniref:helix-turn-helix domain-containing protein n=1 Tax=Streptomyces marokkonensis TaxID=324855 RepID=UPI001AD7BF96|nr:helix-turn-helix transcriptional regulator [Streptomyces marokkonensis]